MRVGVCLPQFTADGAAVLAAAVEIEDLGYSAVSAFDHLSPLGGPPDRPILECFTLLSFVAARTSRVRVLPLVARAGLRPPAMTAHMARTLAAVATGRLVLGFGAGDKANAAEDRSVGLPVLDQDGRRAQLVAVVEALRADVPDVPLWLGGTSVAMQRLAGELADGWNVWAATPAECAAGAATSAAAAGAAGRAAPDVTWGGQVLMAGSDDEAAARLAKWGSGRRPEELARVVAGTADTVATRLRALADVGVTDAQLSFVAGAAAAQRRTFAAEVLPHL